MTKKCLVDIVFDNMFDSYHTTTTIHYWYYAETGDWLQVFYTSSSSIHRPRAGEGENHPPDVEHFNFDGCLKSKITSQPHPNQPA